jgi:four helix bundle protein
MGHLLSFKPDANTGYNGSLVKQQAVEISPQYPCHSNSAMANIAEGFDCDSKREFARFLSIARRSAVEVQSLLYVALDAGYINQDIFQTHYTQAAKAKGLIGGLKRSLER